MIDCFLLFPFAVLAAICILCLSFFCFYAACTGRDIVNDIKDFLKKNKEI